MILFEITTPEGSTFKENDCNLGIQKTETHSLKYALFSSTTCLYLPKHPALVVGEFEMF